MRPIRLGILGTGVATNHLYWPALKKLRKQFRIVAVANRTRRKASRFAAMANVPHVFDTAEQLFKADIDAVLLSVPINILPSMTLKALRAGKPVLAEKPLAPNVAAGERLIADWRRLPAAAKRLPWMIGENYAFLPALLQAERWLAQGALGDVRLAEIRQISLMDERSPYFQTLWRQKPAHVGGFVLDAGVHLAHVLRRLLGEPTQIKGLRAKFNPILPPFDTALALLRFPNGAVGTWVSCFSAHNNDPWLVLRGSRANLELSRGSATLRPPQGQPRIFRSKLDSFQAQFQHFYDVLRKGKPVPYGPAQALADLKLMEKICKAD